MGIEINSLAGDTLTHILVALAFVVAIIVPTLIATNGLAPKKERHIL